MTACCPRCALEFEVQSDLEKGAGLGGILSGSSIQSREITDSIPILLSNQTRPRVRGKARDYSAAFETAWRQYGRKEEKLRAFGEWIVQSRLAGSENLLLPLILRSLTWQGPDWAGDGWKFAPYFERYLKRRKWEDERPPAPTSTGPVSYAKQVEQGRATRTQADRIRRITEENGPRQPTLSPREQYKREVGK